MPFTPTEAKENTACMTTLLQIFPLSTPAPSLNVLWSGLLLWCCTRQLWNNNLKTALKPAKGKASSCYCAIVWRYATALQGSWRWPHKPPDTRPQAAWLPLRRSSVKARQEQSSILPFWTVHYFESKEDGSSPARAAVICCFWTMGDWVGGKLFVCVHLSIRELKLGMRGTQGD